jgi:hypothetical protein
MKSIRGVKMKMTQDEIKKLEKELAMGTYQMNRVKSYGNEIANTISRIESYKDMVESKILDVELYKTYVLNQRKNIKDGLAEIFSYLKLYEVDGHFDEAFKREKEESE